MFHTNRFLIIIIVLFLFAGCSSKSIDKKGFQVSEISEDEEGQKVVGLPIDSLHMETNPRNVLITSSSEHRITPIYKVNYNRRTNQPFTGVNYFHSSWDYEKSEGNNWNGNLMPGFEVVYGYNLVNISHYNNRTQTQNKLFSTPVLIKNFYYPAFSNDTLNFEPIRRNYYMVSVYDEDSNKDGFINAKDLRRFYYFDINGTNKKALIPNNYSVMSSEYDFANDFMYILAKEDRNTNGQMELSEPTDIFWIDLKNPDKVGIQYKSE